MEAKKERAWCVEYILSTGSRSMSLANNLNLEKQMKNAKKNKKQKTKKHLLAIGG